MNNVYGLRLLIQSLLEGKTGWHEYVLNTHDASVGLPASPTLNDRYLCSVAGHGWLAGDIYNWNGKLWNREITALGDHVYNRNSGEVLVKTGATAWSTEESEIDHTQLQNIGRFSHDKIDDGTVSGIYRPATIYDPTPGLPAGPVVGDRYFAIATANGWTQFYLYEWDGTQWIETIPEEYYYLLLLYPPPISTTLATYFEGGIIHPLGESMSHTTLQDIGTYDHDEIDDLMDVGQYVNDTYGVWKSENIPLSMAMAGATAPAFVQVADNGAGLVGVFALEFDHGVDNDIYLNINIPKDCYDNTTTGSPEIQLFFMKEDGNAGNVTFEHEYARANESIGVPVTTIYMQHINAVDTIGARGVYLYRINLGTVFAHNDTFLVRFRRNGTNLADTYAGALYLISAKLVYPANKFGMQIVTYTAIE